MTRIKVYFAPVAFAGEGITATTLQVVVASHPSVAKHPTMWNEAGTVDADTAAYIEMLGKAATLPLLMDRIIPRVQELVGDTVPRRRGPGRPGWSPALYRARWREAVTRGGLRSDAGLEEVAPHFELRDLTIGADPAYLRRLDRRYRRDETPE